MTQDGGYDLKPDETPPPPPPPPAPITPSAIPSAPKPGEPGWVPPVPIIEKADPVESDEPVADPDVEKFKGLAIIGYLCFLIPLAGAPNSKFARYHANQSLLAAIYLMMAIVFITIAEIGWSIVNTHISISLLHAFFSCGLLLLQFLMLAGWVGLVIVGIINAANGEKKALPVIGHWTLIK